MSNTGKVRNIGIVGLGLIGGSIGLALRDPGRKILGFDVSDAMGELARSRSCVDAVTSLEEVAQSELVFVATPPDHVCEVVEAIEAVRAPGTVITDCASVKASIAGWAKRRGLTNFVPGHPMAGHERTSAAFASGWLFRHARWLLTPLPKTAGRTMRVVESVVRDMGATPVRLDPVTHDRQVAILSHLPHALAASLVRVGAELESAELAAGSWRDLTRVGGVDPALWSQILLGNADAVARVLRDTEADLAQLRNAIEAGDADAVREYLSQAKIAKQSLEA